jgi:hypothetical protein
LRSPPASDCTDACFRHAVERRNSGGRVAEVAALRECGIEHEAVKGGHLELARRGLRRLGLGRARALPARRPRRGAGAAAARRVAAIAAVASIAAVTDDRRDPRSRDRRRAKASRFFAHHRRRRDDRAFHRDDQVPQHRVVELERVLELVQRSWSTSMFIST